MVNQIKGEEDDAVESDDVEEEEGDDFEEAEKFQDRDRTRTLRKPAQSKYTWTLAIARTSSVIILCQNLQGKANQALDSCTAAVLTLLQTGRRKKHIMFSHKKVTPGLGPQLAWHMRDLRVRAGESERKSKKGTEQEDEKEKRGKR